MIPRIELAVASLFLLAGSNHAFTARSVRQQTRGSTTQVNMVLEKPQEKKIAKIEQLKVDSDYLVHPLYEVCCGKCCALQRLMGA